MLQSQHMFRGVAFVILGVLLSVYSIKNGLLKQEVRLKRSTISSEPRYLSGNDAVTVGVLGIIIGPLVTVIGILYVVKDLRPPK